MVRTFAIGAALLLLLGALGVLSSPALSVDPRDPSPRRDDALAFGMDAASIRQQERAGAKPDYGTIWVGPWVLKNGWAGTAGQLRTLRDAGVTPAIHLYYWGNDISKHCLQHGCWSNVHGVYKDPSGWQRLTDGLTKTLRDTMGGKPVLVFLETEFNKNDVSYWETLDAQLADKANVLKRGYGAVHVVLPFGNWNHDAWRTFDRAAAASHSIGVQAMRGSTRDSWTSYHALYESLLAGVKKADRTFGKPIVVHDVALSSHPDPGWRGAQATSLKELLTGLGTLKAHGVKGLIYRAWQDDPRGNLKEYYGAGERHWGLVDAHGARKPSAAVWLAAVQAERKGGVAVSTAPPTGSGATGDASFSVSNAVNAWWADVRVQAPTAVTKVELRTGSGPWIPMWKTAWGTWAKSTHLPAGSDVVFRATLAGGAQAVSPTYDWMQSGGGLRATFRVADAVNAWWVDVYVQASDPLRSVQVRVNDGGWSTLPRTHWGSWAKSLHVPDGSRVVFQAIGTDGATATSGTVTW